LTYTTLFKTYPIVRQLSLIQFIVYFGAWFSNVAIYSMLVDFGASAFIISAVAAAHLMPAILQAPISGAIIDKVKIKPLMTLLILIEILMTSALFLINGLGDVWLLIVIIFFRMAASSFFFTIEMSLFPKILSGIALQKTNEIHSIIWSFSYAFGMAVSGFVVDKFGPKFAFGIDLMFFLLAFFYFIKVKVEIEFEKDNEKFTKMIKDGLAYLRSNKKIIHLILLHCSVGLTAFDALVTLLADYNYKEIIAVPLAIGITNAVRAFALMIGPFVVSNYVNKNNLFLIFLAQGFAVMLWAILQFDFYFALIAMFFVGLFTTTIWSYTYALLQEETEQKYLGRVIAYNDMIFMVANILTTAFIGVMASFGVSLSIITLVLGFAFVLVGFYSRFVIRIVHG
jgi:MFS family permease